MRPLIYGYLRVAGDAHDEGIRQTELELRRFAEVNGFRLASMFREYTAGSQVAFNMLIEELKQVDAHLVVVPSFAHLSCHPLVRDTMLTHLDIFAHTDVIAADEQ